MYPKSIVNKRNYCYNDCNIIYEMMELIRIFLLIRNIIFVKIWTCCVFGKIEIEQKGTKM